MAEGLAIVGARTALAGAGAGAESLAGRTGTLAGQITSHVVSLPMKLYYDYATVSKVIPDVNQVAKYSGNQAFFENKITQKYINSQLKNPVYTEKQHTENLINVTKKYEMKLEEAKNNSIDLRKTQLKYDTGIKKGRVNVKIEKLKKIKEEVQKHENLIQEQTEKYSKDRDELHKLNALQDEYTSYRINKGIDKIEAKEIKNRDFQKMREEEFQKIDEEHKAEVSKLEGKEAVLDEQGIKKIQEIQLQKSKELLDLEEKYQNQPQSKPAIKGYHKAKVIGNLLNPGVFYGTDLLANGLKRESQLFKNGTLTKWREITIKLYQQRLYKNVELQNRILEDTDSFIKKIEKEKTSSRLQYYSSKFKQKVSMIWNNLQYYWVHWRKLSDSLMTQQVGSINNLIRSVFNPLFPNIVQEPTWIQMLRISKNTENVFSEAAFDPNKPHNLQPLFEYQLPTEADLPFLKNYDINAEKLEQLHKNIKNFKNQETKKAEVKTQIIQDTKQKLLDYINKNSFTEANKKVFADQLEALRVFAVENKMQDLENLQLTLKKQFEASSDISFASATLQQSILDEFSKADKIQQDIIKSNLSFQEIIKKNITEEVKLKEQVHENFFEKMKKRQEEMDNRYEKSLSQRNEQLIISNENYDKQAEQMKQVYKQLEEKLKKEQDEREVRMQEEFKKKEVDYENRMKLKDKEYTNKQSEYQRLENKYEEQEKKYLEETKEIKNEKKEIERQVEKVREEINKIRDEREGLKLDIQKQNLETKHQMELNKKQIQIENDSTAKIYEQVNASIDEVKNVVLQNQKEIELKNNNIDKITENSLKSLEQQFKLHQQDSLNNILQNLSQQFNKQRDEIVKENQNQFKTLNYEKVGKEISDMKNYIKSETNLQKDLLEEYKNTIQKLEKQIESKDLSFEENKQIITEQQRLQFTLQERQYKTKLNEILEQKKQELEAQRNDLQKQSDTYHQQYQQELQKNLKLSQEVDKLRELLIQKENLIKDLEQQLQNKMIQNPTKIEIEQQGSYDWHARTNLKIIDKEIKGWITYNKDRFTNPNLMIDQLDKLDNIVEKDYKDLGENKINQIILVMDNLKKQMISYTPFSQEEFLQTMYSF